MEVAPPWPPCAHCLVCQAWLGRPSAGGALPRVTLAAPLRRPSGTRSEGGFAVRREKERDGSASCVEKFSAATHGEPGILL